MNWNRGTALRPGAALAAAILAALASLAGCGAPEDGGSGPTSSVTSTAPASPQPSPSPASPSATSTLSAAEQEAFEQATAAVMAYRQTIADLYSGARTEVDDLHLVATGDLRDRELDNVSKGLTQGYRAEPEGVRLELVAAEPQEIRLNGKSPTVVVRACVDGTALTAVAPDGSRTPGRQESLDYTVVKTSYLQAPGWAVEDVKGQPTAEGRKC